MNRNVCAADVRFEVGMKANEVCHDEYLQAAAKRRRGLGIASPDGVWGDSPIVPRLLIE